MTLIKSVSGIRGTIGGVSSENLTPIDILECTAAYMQILKHKYGSGTIVIGRDGRVSGEMVSQLCIQTIISMGFDVIDLGLSTTPTVSILVPHFNGIAGVVITASHNPAEWNALKFLNNKGEFIDPETGNSIVEFSSKRQFQFETVDNLGTVQKVDNGIEIHIEKILALEFLDVELIKSKAYKVIVDGINSTGNIAVPALLDKLNCSYKLVNDQVDGLFSHNPEPLEEHLQELIQIVKLNDADMGIAVDPDVDRLVFIDENGKMFGEEYTIVAVADFILRFRKGSTVSNLSSSRALSDLSKSTNCQYYTSAVGEVHVVKKMKEVGAVIGGEGNGGVILPDLHYGRDALIGIALFLNHLANLNCSVSELKKIYPSYVMRKDKILFDPNQDANLIVEKLKNAFSAYPLNLEDGIKIDMPDGWIQLRKSNTEPIFRLYAEAIGVDHLDKMVDQVKEIINH